LLTLVGALLLILGWFGVSGKGLIAEQMPYVISGGLGGIFLMGVGAALWLSSDLRDEWTKLDRIEHVLEAGLEGLGLSRDRDGTPILSPLVLDRGHEPDVTATLSTRAAANGSSAYEPADSGGGSGL
jgi:hypothetical protein